MVRPRVASTAVMLSITLVIQGCRDRVKPPMELVGVWEWRDAACYGDLGPYEFGGIPPQGVTIEFAPNGRYVESNGETQTHESWPTYQLFDPSPRRWLLSAQDTSWVLAALGGTTFEIGWRGLDTLVVASRFSHSCVFTFRSVAR